MWLRAREQVTPVQPSGLAQSQPEERVASQKATRDVKITVKPRTQGVGGLEVNLFWTGAEGRRHRVRRASPYQSVAETQRWAHELLRELSDAEEPGELEATEPSTIHQPLENTSNDDDANLTFGEFVPRFLAYCKSPAAGRRGANSQGEIIHKQCIIDQHLLRFFGKLELKKIGAKEVDAYVCKKASERSKRTGKPLSNSTIANHLGLLRRMLKVAHRWELITRIPEIQLPRKRTIEEYLTRKQTRALIEAAEPLFRDLILVAVRTGLRLGELRELRVGDLDLERARLRVARQRTQADEITLPKGGKKRTVQLPPDAVAVLSKRVAGLDRDELVFCKPPGYRAPHRIEPPARGGEPWSPKDVFNAVQRAGEAAGIERSVGVHALRHTFATQAVAAGVPLSVVSRQLGHADIQTTMRYAHHAPELTPGIFDRLAEGDAAVGASQKSG
jgi:integrase